MSIQVDRKNGAKMKISSGWFAAGVSFHRALALLSDGAFKLFAHICLEADRSNGRFEASQTDLCRALRKSRRIIGKYLAELEHEGICYTISGSNQYCRNVIEIVDDYWPYHRPTIAEETKRKEEDAYVAAVRDSFLAIGCTRGKFGIGDERRARAMMKQGVSLELLKKAMLLGAIRKYGSWLNGGSAEPIGSLAFFETLVSEVKQLPPGYGEYLQPKFVQLARLWEEMKQAETCRVQNGTIPPDEQ